jgi:hypothetical protein
MYVCLAVVQSGTDRGCMCAHIGGQIEAEGQAIGSYSKARCLCVAHPHPFVLFLRPC